MASQEGTTAELLENIREFIKDEFDNRFGELNDRLDKIETQYHELTDRLNRIETQYQILDLKLENQQSQLTNLRERLYDLRRETRMREYQSRTFTKKEDILSKTYALQDCHLWETLQPIQIMNCFFQKSILMYRA